MDEVAARRYDGNHDGLAADAAVLDVLLARDRAIDLQLDLLYAIRALQEGGFQVGHLSRVLP